MTNPLSPRPRKSIVRSVLQGVVVALALSLVGLYVWAFATLRADDKLRASDDGDFLVSRKLGTGRRSSTESFTAATGRSAKRLREKRRHASPPPEPSPPPSPRRMSFPFPDEKYRIYSIPTEDRSKRCMLTGICDGNYTCGPDLLGCVTDAGERQARIREAARWSWVGYR